MPKQIWRIIIRLLIIWTYSLLHPAISLCSEDKHPSSLNDLVNEFKYYTTTNVTFHAGGVYEHSLWVAITINEWWHTNSPWTQDINDHDYQIALLAGLLHDVGKAGDLVFSFYTKPTHDQNGQAYILDEKPFYLAAGGTFNFKKLFQALSISDEDKRLVAFLVGAHSDFGWIMNAFTEKKNTIRECLATYTEKLNTHARSVGLSYPVNKRLMQIMILLSAADINGAHYCPCTYSFSFGDLTVDKSPALTHEQATNKFNEFKYDTYGLILRNALIEGKDYSSLDKTSDSFVGTIKVPCLT